MRQGIGCECAWVCECCAVGSIDAKWIFIWGGAECMQQCVPIRRSALLIFIMCISVLTDDKGHSNVTHTQHTHTQTHTVRSIHAYILIFNLDSIINVLLNHFLFISSKLNGFSYQFLLLFIQSLIKIFFTSHFYFFVIL